MTFSLILYYTWLMGMTLSEPEKFILFYTVMSLLVTLAVHMVVEVMIKPKEEGIAKFSQG